MYRQCAVCYTDFWESYETVLPSKRHRSVGKDSGQTNHIERFNCTLRQRGLKTSQKVIVVLKETGKSYRRNLVLHSSLQRILTSLGLPYF